MPPWETCGALPLISTLRSPFWVLRLRLPWRAEEQRVFRTEKRKRAEAGGCLVTRLQSPGRENHLEGLRLGGSRAGAAILMLGLPCRVAVTLHVGTTGEDTSVTTSVSEGGMRSGEPAEAPCTSGPTALTAPRQPCGANSAVCPGGSASLLGQSPTSRETGRRPRGCPSPALFYK